MRSMLTLAVWAALAGAAMAQPASAPAPTACSHDLPEGGRVLCHETIVAAPVGEVWALFATSGGLHSWLAPVAAIDLRVGGMWETAYDPSARLGDAGNIRNRILSFLPERMLSIQIAQAPPGFPHADEATHLWTVIEFEPVAANATRVRVSMLGFAESEGGEALYNFFDQGNAYTLRKLAERIADGPTDWSEHR